MKILQIWYDQTGNGRHATEVTEVNQPRIVNAGVVDTANGVPTFTLSTRGWRGPISEVVLFDSELSTTDRQTLERN